MKHKPTPDHAALTLHIGVSGQADNQRKKAVFRIHARLIEQGSNFYQFALTYGYKPRTVTQVVARWAGQHGEPRGRLTYQILRDLSKAVGYEIIPGVLSVAA